MSLISKDTVPDIEALMPDDAIQSVSLCPRLPDSSSGSSYDTGIDYRARWKPLSDETIALLGGNFEVEWREWQLYQIDGQTTAPAVGFRITDEDGANWYIKSVQVKQFGKVHNCRSYKEAV